MDDITLLFSYRMVISGTELTLFPFEKSILILRTYGCCTLVDLHRGDSSINCRLFTPARLRSSTSLSQCSNARWLLLLFVDLSPWILVVFLKTLYYLYPLIPNCYSRLLLSLVFSLALTLICPSRSSFNFWQNMFQTVTVLRSSHALIHEI